MTKIEEYKPYSKPTDIINLSWTSFSLLQPCYLREEVKKINECLDEYRYILEDFNRQNELIKGKLKVDGKEIFYDPGKELEKYLEREIIQENSISNFSQIVYERSMDERKKIINKYIDLTKNKIVNILQTPAGALLKSEELSKLYEDISMLNKLLRLDNNGI